MAGVVLGFAASKITQYYTSTETNPVQDIAKAARTGPATTVLEGISSGLESAVWALVAIAVAIGVALALGGGNIGFSLYLVALTGIGMLATTGIVVAEDTFGPVADNAAGIAEMAGEFEGEPERIMVSLDAVGNTTKAVTKGFAIGSAVIAAVALFARYAETIAKGTLAAADVAAAEANGALASLVKINVADPKTFIGLLIGGSVAFLFSSLAIRAVSRTAGTVVQEVRRQFREKPGIMDRTERPDYGAVIDICTTASLRELMTPALLAVLTPGHHRLRHRLPGPGRRSWPRAIVTGQLMANFLSNSGGAWDNAKKYIEDGHEGGKGSEAHKAAVIGDTVGDPFKDTAGPALNPLIKVMNLVSLLMLPAILSLRDNNVRYVIAAAALVVVLGALVWSKRQGGGMGEDLAESEAELELDDRAGRRGHARRSQRHHPPGARDLDGRPPPRRTRPAGQDRGGAQLLRRGLSRGRGGCCGSPTSWGVPSSATTAPWARSGTSASASPARRSKPWWWATRPRPRWWGGRRWPPPGPTTCSSPGPMAVPRCNCSARSPRSGALRRRAPVGPRRARHPDRRCRRPPGGPGGRRPPRTS